MASPALSDWASVRLPSAHAPLARQISPDKDVNFPCTTAALTRSPAPGGLRHLVLTRPGTEPSMRVTRPIPGARPPGQPSAVQNRSQRFGLSVGSHLCARASSRHPLARLPLPSASRCFRPFGGHLRYSYRGLSPHQFMPMPGVHNGMQRTALRAAADAER